MKNVIIGTIVVALVGFFALQYAGADPTRGPGSFFGGGCRNFGAGPTLYRGSETDQKAIDSFLKDTVTLRSQLIDKRAEYQKLTLTEEYDSEKAAALTKEIYQLQDQLRQKAREAGVNNGYCDREPGYGRGWGHHHGNGWGHHRGNGWSHGGSYGNRFNCANFSPAQ